MRKFVPVVALLALVAPAAAQAAAEQSCAPSSACYTKYAAAIEDPRRDADRTRDRFRNPADTLEFMRVEPGMVVVDYMPAGGWYTRILVPYLGEQGQYIGLNPAPPADNERFASYIGGLRETFPQQAAGWNLEGAEITAYNADQLPEEMNGTVDRVLIFRGMHTLQRNNIVESELRQVYDLLKKDGLLGIVQHRANDNAPDAYVDGDKGYMREKDVIALVEAHGFELVDKSEINANPRDTADHPDGVWTLPPSLRGDEANRVRYEAIGESDRMTLLFRKQA